MTGAHDDDTPFAELLDDVLQRLLDGRQPDAAEIAAKHPAAAHRLDEALALARDVAGRRTTVRPVLPGYEIVRELGRGGMGTVYLARQQELDRIVALKVLPQTLGLAERSRQRFLAEARALARVEHENVVRIHRIVDDGELFAFEMEFIDGPSLQQLLDHLRQHRERTGSPPGLAQVAELLQSPAPHLGTRSLTQFFVQQALALARALGAMHAQGLVHRDVKPANVLLRRGGEPVLVDFGLVRGLPHDPSRTVGFVGTPVYSSPEQLRGEGPVGPTADVYGLAVTLYECLALSTPFAGRTTGEVLRRVESGAFAPLRRAAPGVPRDLETIVAHAMEADPAQRYPDATALADDLQRLLDLQPIRARPLGPVRRFGKVLRRQRKTLLAAGTGALLVAASMWPLLDHVQAASTRRERAQDHARAAQLSLLSRDPQRRDDEPLQKAQAEYERALELDPGDAAARREHDVVRLSRWLQRLSVPEPGALPRALAGDEFRGLCAGLGPLTAETARRLAAGTEYGEAPATDLGAAATEDRAGVGLLAFLFGDFRLCENAWGTLPPDQHARPLVEAGLGLIELADGRAELAYVRLLQARRSFGAADPLALELAAAALALGELALARHWLDGVPTPCAHEGTRERLLLDLRLARGDDEGLADAYERLAQEHPGDALPRHRLAQLAWRRGDLADAGQRLEQLVEEWPRQARFRLDCARVALQQHRTAAYLAQALAVVEQDFGRGRSRGAVADMLEILRLGGLHELHRRGVAATGSEHVGRAQFGGEMPLRAFVPPRLADSAEQLVPWIVAASKRAAALAEPDRLLGDAAHATLITTPLLLGMLPWRCALTTRAALLAAPWAVTWASPTLLRAARAIALPWLGRHWHTVTLSEIEPPPHARPPARFGSALAAAGDRTGDGVDDVLVACGCVQPHEARGQVMLVDGSTRATLATLASDSDQHMFGYSLAVVGDVDGDGARDWLIGAPSGDPEALQGRAELWSSGTHQRLTAIEGREPGFGVSVASLDDIDGDGTCDFAVATAPLLRNSAAQGSVQILSGHTRQVLRVHTNDAPGIWYGACIANAGDVDGDGLADLVVGGNFGGAPGLVHVYSGRTHAKLHTWSDPDPESGFGTVVLGTGDVDGDGQDDVSVSAVRRDTASGADHLFVFSGATGKRLARITLGAAGTAAGSSVLAYRMPRRTMLLVGLPLSGPTRTGALEFWLPGGAKASTVLGPVTRGNFGGALTLVGDRDGDGLPEVVVGPGPGGGDVWVLASRQIRFGS